MIGKFAPAGDGDELLIKKSFEHAELIIKLNCEILKIQDRDSTREKSKQFVDVHSNLCCITENGFDTAENGAFKARELKRVSR